MDREHVADADDAGLAAGEVVQAADQLRVGSLADQQALGFNARTKAVMPRMTPITTEAAPS